MLLFYSSNRQTDVKRQIDLLIPKRWARKEAAPRSKPPLIIIDIQIGPTRPTPEGVSSYATRLGLIPVKDWTGTHAK
jgi:hypothetical protein